MNRPLNVALPTERTMPASVREAIGDFAREAIRREVEAVLGERSRNVQRAIAFDVLLALFDTELLRERFRALRETFPEV